MEQYTSFYQKKWADINFLSKQQRKNMVREQSFQLLHFAGKAALNNVKAMRLKKQNITYHTF